MEVPGKNIKKLIENIEDYSFPFQKEKISEKENYNILVESTHSLKSSIIKKTNQLRKYYLFFSLLIRSLKNYKDYLESFEDYFIGKYFVKIKIGKGNEFNYKADFSFLKKTIVLIATDQTLPNFLEIKNFIENSNIPSSIEDNVKKCFPNIYKIEKQKEYKNEININKDSKDKKKDLSEKEKKEKYINKKFESMQLMKFLLDNINKEEAWIVKIIYFDLYFNLIEPGYSISENLKKINETINTEIGDLKNENKNLIKELGELKNEKNKLGKDIGQLNIKNEKLETEVEIFRNKNILLENRINRILIYIEKKFPKDKILDFIKNPNMEENQNASEVQEEQTVSNEENQKFKKNK